ncbi:hypothetical protein [Uliginosibacterium gangwonense]|uniref:hypothetical protein n=1 Tax=Uliginosibacterium gangwonense TaxID=392736 RepID=UPI000363B809|nr:hypothetical protein [Uliginosibacterium gangwonense]
MQLTFGSGELFAQMIRDAAGNVITNPTPIRIAGLQELSLDFSGELKEFYGQNRYALATAMGKVKTTGKMKGALINGLALNNLFFGNNMATGTMKALYADTNGIAIPSSTPYTITTTPLNSGTFIEDLGVVNANGQTMVKVAASPVSGQYSVDASGNYVFAAADAGLQVYRSYSYSYSLASAKQITLNNIAMGQAPQIKIAYLAQYQGKKCLVELESITSTKLHMFSAKSDDFSVPEIDFSASTDAAGFKLGTIWVQE